MTQTDDDAPSVLDLHPAPDDFLGDVLDGLSRSPRQLPCKYLYDERGADLFEQICRQPEYYPTQTELGIMRRFAEEIAEAIGPRAMLIEPGSGDAVKTRLLLEAMREPVACAPMDISREQLERVTAELSGLFPDVQMLPICADFTRPVSPPRPNKPCDRRVVYFPGSTIGNLDEGERSRLLRQFAHMVGPGGGLLIGVDLIKDAETLEAAYDDRAGVTAAFNTNLLSRINRELDGDFDLDGFAYEARWRSDRRRVEMSQVSRRRQTVRVGEQSFDFVPGERILVECSHKFTIDGFAKVAADAGLTLRRRWTDDADWFAVLFFTVD